MILSNKRITKALISLCKCAGWCGPLLFANSWRQVLWRRGPYVLWLGIFSMLIEINRSFSFLVMKFIGFYDPSVHFSSFSFMISHRLYIAVLKFVTLVICKKGLGKQRRPRSDCFWRSSLIRVFPVCYSDKYFVNSSIDNPHFIWEQKEKSVQN